MTNKQSKSNDGCSKIFRLLNLLYKNEAYYDKVIEIFKDESDNSKTLKNNQVILNKYLNTLKVFGIKVEKVNGKFIIANSLYNIPFSEEDLQALKILYATSEKIPDENINKDFREFISMFRFLMSSEDKNRFDNLTHNPDISFHYSDIKEQISECKNICKRGHNVEIKYSKNNEIISIKCTPKDLIYTSKNAYLQVYISSSRENMQIPLNRILSISELPQLANSIEITTTVVFKVKGRLAKNYKLKENEHSEGTDEDGNLIIINTEEPIEQLTQRLLRYMYNCEIISPKSLRNKMKEIIEQTIENYKNK